MWLLRWAEESMTHFNAKFFRFVLFLFLFFLSPFVRERK